jgi:hypothetical protein
MSLPPISDHLVAISQGGLNRQGQEGVRDTKAVDGHHRLTRTHTGNLKLHTVYQTRSIAAPMGSLSTFSSAPWQWSTGGGQATVTHTGTGQYEVRLPNVASATGVAHVTAYRTSYRGQTCAVTGYRPSGSDELVDVRCVDQNRRR